MAESNQSATVFRPDDIEIAATQERAGQRAIASDIPLPKRHTAEPTPATKRGK